MVKESEPTELPPVFIRERMKYPKVTGDVLAERMETTPATISRLLNGKRKMTLEWLFAFSKALNTPISELFSPPGVTGKISDERSAAKLLEHIAIIPEGEGPKAYNILFSVFGEDDEKPSQNHPDDQSSRASRLRAE